MYKTLCIMLSTYIHTKQHSSTEGSN